MKPSEAALKITGLNVLAEGYARERQIYRENDLDPVESIPTISDFDMFVDVHKNRAKTMVLFTGHLVARALIVGGTISYIADGLSGF